MNPHRCPKRSDYWVIYCACGKRLPADVKDTTAGEIVVRCGDSRCKRLMKMQAQPNQTPALTVAEGPKCPVPGVRVYGHARYAPTERSSGGDVVVMDTGEHW